MLCRMSVFGPRSPSKTRTEIRVSQELPSVARGTATEELPGGMTSEESPGASAIFNGSDV
jgi:hypothetical protein